MRIFVPKETLSGDTRVALVPATAARLVKLGAQVEVQADLGASIRCPDAGNRDAGAEISFERGRSLAGAERRP